MKLLVIGNSLAVTLREAWPALAVDHSDIAIEWFVAPHKVFSRLETGDDGTFGLRNLAGQVRRGRKWLERLNGRLSVSLEDYDAILVVGPHFRIGVMLQTLADYRVTGLPVIRDDAPPLSRAAFCALHDDIIAQELDRFAGFPAERTLFAPLNRPAEGFSTDRAATSHRWEPFDIRAASRARALDFLYRRVADAIAGRGMTPILQPAETLAPSGLSRRAFAGGRRLDAGRRKSKSPRRDHIHLTAGFGSLLWQPILTEIARRSVQTG